MVVLCHFRALAEMSFFAKFLLAGLEVFLAR
jgi:hypothetical protein